MLAYDESDNATVRRDSCVGGALLVNEELPSVRKFVLIRRHLPYVALIE